MIVVVSGSDAPEVRDLDNMRGFHVETTIARGGLSSLPAGPVTFDGPDTAWVDIAWLRAYPGLAGDEAKLAAFDGMLAYARPRGWVDDDRGAIRAHVEAAGARA